ncbi:MAG TPA: hypothetical protein VMU84_20490 [Thermoanaerobaculia bacterium]|nr:hypothetical protein [Thermoanaerobaculia bacterium]
MATSFVTVQQYLNDIIDAWTKENGGDPPDLPGVHHDPKMGWGTKEQLANSTPYKKQLIAPGVKGKDSNLYKALTTGVTPYPRMPAGGPFMTAAQTDYIAQWIDDGMPD